MARYVLFVKETVGKDKGKWKRLTKHGRWYTSKTAAIKHRKGLLPFSHKKIGIRKIKR